jgi:hypothetical protein
VALQEFAPDVISRSEWHSVCTERHNALLEGPPHATERLLTLLQPYLCRPAVWKSPASRLELPAGECGALVLENVSGLDRHDQAALLNWLGTRRTQVISTTMQPLFPSIARGLFDEALYYRLNVMLLSIGSSATLI